MGRPLLWAAAAFAGGILSAERYPLPARPLLLAIAVGYAAWVGLLLSGRISALYAGAGRALAPAALVSLFALLGHAAVALDPMAAEVRAASAWEGRRGRVEGRVAAPPEVRDGRQRVEIRVSRIGAVSLPVPFTAQATLPGAPVLRYGDQVSVRGAFVPPAPAGNPGEQDLGAALRRRGIATLLRVASHSSPAVLSRHGGSRWRRGIYELRDRMVGPLRSLPEPYGGLLAGLLLGASAGGGAEMEDLFLRAGLLHLLVVSGAQVGLVAAATLFAVGAFGGRHGLGLGLAAGVILFFATMVGWSPSVGRAAIMGLVGVSARLLGRDPDAASTLALAALLWLAFHPATLFGLGFQLSFAATWGLLFLSPALTPPLRPRWVAQLIAVTLAAQIAVAPLLAVVFQRVSPAALPANVLVLPLIAAIVPAGFGLSLVGLILPALASALVPAFLPPLWMIVAVARVFASAPGAQLWLPPLQWWHGAAAYLLLGLLPRCRRGAMAWSSLLTIALSVTLAFAGGGVLAANVRGPHLTVAVLDVGQGDAIFVRGPTGRTMLLDGGGEVEVGGRSPQGGRGRNDIGLRRVVPALRRMGVRRVDVVMLSHAHEDHVGGLPAVLENFRVDLVIDPGVPHPSPSYLQFLDLVRRRRIPYALGRQGQRIDLGGGAAVDILWPPGEGEGPVTDNPVHDRGLVARLTYGRVSVLLTGDVEAEVEAALLRSGLPLQSTVLKVGHHGSRTSTTPEFLDAVRPAFAVISLAAENLFGHPHPQTLRTLAARGVPIYRTDHVGAVVLQTDGRALTVETMRRLPTGAGAPAAGSSP
ncbi:MAG: DNA internalization-related competence protein ComEC/Rec2 [bacterium]